MRSVGFAAVLAALAAGTSGCLVPGAAVHGCYPCAARETAATAETPLVQFIAMGDFGTVKNRDVARALRQFIAAAPATPERVLELGDNFYQFGLVGAVKSCDELPRPTEAVERQAVRILKPFEYLRDQGITLTALPGNHDYRCFGQGLANEAHIDQWLPKKHRWGRRWDLVYGLPREIVLADGAVQIVTLDSERMLARRDFRLQSAARLQNLLAQGKGLYRWQIVAAHHPLQTNGIHNGADFSSALRKLEAYLLLPNVLADLGVAPFHSLNQDAYSIRYGRYRRAIEDAVTRSGATVPLFLGGHDHQLQLLAPRAAGLPYVVVSGSAANCNPVRAGKDTIFAAPKRGFVVVTAYQEHLDVDFVGTNGCEEREPCARRSEVRPVLLFHYRIPAQRSPRQLSGGGMSCPQGETRKGR